MKHSKKEIGVEGEEIAVKSLKRKGYKIVQRNYRCKLGEIDIIAERNGVLIFVEVKTKRTNDFGPPQYAVTPAQRDQISKSALCYIKEKGLTEQSCRFDVITINFSPGSNKSEVGIIRTSIPPLAHIA